MKRILLIICSLFICNATMYAQVACDTIYINMPDGNIAKYNVHNIDSITFIPHTIKAEQPTPGTTTQMGAAISWIDDDFKVFDNSGELLPIYKTVHDWCIEKGIRYDFATITRTGSNYINIIKQWEEEGFNFLMHPTHTGWYDYKDENVHDIALVRKYFITNMRFFNTNIASAKRRILVWPGSSNSFPENVDFVSQYVECAITATTVGSNPGTVNDRYQLKRLSLLLSSSMTKTQLKNLIKQYVDNGDWVILYTHLYNHKNTDVVDETTNSVANLMEIVEYANSLCPLRSTESVWSERKKLYDRQ